MHPYWTYKTFSDCSCVRKSGKGPFKLLFDKSLKEKTNLKSYNFESPTKKKQMGLESHKYCNFVRFDMADAISPVNPLEDKFLVTFTNIILEDIYD
jgi:hypothetical protein